MRYLGLHKICFGAADYMLWRCRAASWGQTAWAPVAAVGRMASSILCGRMLLPKIGPVLQTLLTLLLRHERGEVHPHGADVVDVGVDLGGKEGRKEGRRRKVKEDEGNTTKEEEGRKET